MKDEMEKIPGCAPELAGVSRLLEEIRMPEEMGEAVLRCLGRTAGPAPDGSTAEADQPVSDRKPEEEPFEGTADLSSHLLQAVRNRESGPWKGLPEQIFLDTMGCFSRFVREHHRSYGTWGFDRGFWTTRQAEARLFRIGQLEYELAEENGEKQLQLHIPSDALLETDLLNKSVGEAREFLKQWRPEWKDLPLQLESWLLKGRPFPSGHPVNEVTFLTELGTRMLLGTHDIDRMQGTVELFCPDAKMDFPGIREDMLGVPDPFCDVALLVR